MQFTDSLFLFYFLPAALICHRLAVSRQKGKAYPNQARVVFFLVTAVFYGLREPWWLIPFFTGIGFDFLWASLLVRTENPKWRKMLCVASVVQNIALLSVFKYWDFFLSLLTHAAPTIASGLPHLTVGGGPLSLPPGISFYTFESLSFVIDVYRREITPPRDPREFFAFIGMFPRFIAGPIVRYRDLRTQFQHYRGMQVEGGLLLFAWGFFLKCAFADNFEVFVEYAFHSYETQEFFSSWLGVTAYSLQVYFDFSGYSLMAMGLGKCFGFQFPENFKQPYLATSLQEFWRRWHITLSTWLRDYVYVSLGGSRRGKMVTYRNLFLTMLVGGLWHGARGTFVCWGAWHGLALCVERGFGARVPLPGPLKRMLTLLVVMVGWVFFRSNYGMHQAFQILKSMASPFAGSAHLNPEALRAAPVSVALCLLGLVYCFFIERHLNLAAFEDFSWIKKIGAYTVFIASLLWVLSTRLVPFLYFQF